jgi:hypothetical protein
MIETLPFFKSKESLIVIGINVQPDRDSNLGPLEYRTAALLTELTGRLQTIISD